ncbi:MAG: helix-turn-helix transcriptional regulator [Clostridia bacterium]|nr:helix-turn-helix transcriptional regulator [Clostridia bacterium]
MGVIRKLNDNVNIVGSNIKKIREEQQLSQPDLCRKLELLGVTMYIADIYEIENNKRLIKDFEIKAFSMALNVSLDTLYDDTEKFFEH